LRGSCDPPPSTPGLHTALSNYVEQWSEHTGITIVFIVWLGEAAHIARRSKALFRIVQEALTNVLSTPRAKRVSVIVEHRNNQLRALVEMMARVLTLTPFRLRQAVAVGLG